MSVKGPIPTLCAAYGIRCPREVRLDTESRPTRVGLHFIVAGDVVDRVVVLVKAEKIGSDLYGFVRELNAESPTKVALVYEDGEPMLGEQELGADWRSEIAAYVENALAILADYFYQADFDVWQYLIGFRVERIHRDLCFNCVRLSE